MNYDLIVVGGGPGGATVSTLVAKTGKKVLLLEKQRFPRHQVGESLLPMTVHGICPMLGIADELKAQGYPIKTGSSFRWGRSPDIWSFQFVGLKILEQADAGYAYQVGRSKFDSILLDNAKRNGVDVREEHTALGLIVEDDRVVGLRYRDSEGREHSARARYVVDASGNTSAIHEHVGERVYSEFFRNVAMYGYFLGGKRLPPPTPWGNILSAAFREGWFWYIPLSEELTSVGVVIDKTHADRLRGNQDAAFQGLVRECPIIDEYLADARRVTDGEYGQFRIRKDWSYCATRFWKPGVVILGDAAAFVDPIFSQGVHLSTYSALLAARSINTALDTPGADESRLFDEFERRYRIEFEMFYRFLITFYDMDQDVESYYWSARTFNRTEEKANDAFISLVSGVSSGEFFRTYSGASRVLQTYAETETVRNPIEAARRAFEVLPPAAHDLETHRTAAYEGGLVHSTDGLHWC